MKKSQRKKRQPSARELFEQCTTQLRELNQRYDSLFRFVHDPKTYAPQGVQSEVIPVTLEEDVRAGDTIHVRVPLKFELRRGV